MKKNLIIHNGNISIGGQEKMLIELLKLLSPEKYNILLLIEENNGVRNDYINEIPSWVEYKFLTTEKFMQRLENAKRNKNFISKFYYSILLKRKKKIAIKNMEKYLGFADIIIDYDMGLLRYLHKLKIVGKTLVGWCHLGEGERLKNKRKQQNLEKYNYIVTLNEVMKQGFEKNTSVPQILKIYNFMDFSLIREKSKIPMQKDYGDFIISIGSLTKVKNHQLLIRSFSLLKKDRKIKEKLIILGEGKERENLERLINELGMRDEILLLGKIKDPYNYLLNSKLFVLPSKLEGMPLTLLEALSLNKMIIATKNCGSDEILQYKYGVSVDEDEKEMAKTIEFYLRNKDEREKFEKIASERIKDFEREKIKIVIEKFIDTL